MNNTGKILVRAYKEDDAPHLAAIYFHTIHQINNQDYSPEQLDAWAPLTSLDPEKWVAKWRILPPIVAVLNDEIVGFAELETNGHIDCFYCHYEFQGRGIGTALMRVIEEKARENKIKRLFAEVSITARPFFEARGFTLQKEQLVTVKGITLTNFLMEKMIP